MLDGEPDTSFVYDNVRALPDSRRSLLKRPEPVGKQKIRGRPQTRCSISCLPQSKGARISAVLFDHAAHEPHGGRRPEWGPAS
jgi:hypothetical protein